MIRCQEPSLSLSVPFLTSNLEHLTSSSSTRHFFLHLLSSQSVLNSFLLAQNSPFVFNPLQTLFSASKPQLFSSHAIPNSFAKTPGVGAGHVVKVRLPEEIRSLGAGKIARRAAVRPDGVGNLEKTDFLETRALRQAIHAREGGFCFYCLRRLRPMVRCLDHVVARVRGGSNGYRNLVSSCAECNSQKGERRAEDFLRWLCREGRLSAGEFRGRFRALARLAAGKLRPSARSAQRAIAIQKDGRKCG
jgi:HNH endonuclease